MDTLVIQFPALFVISLTVAWFVLLLIFMGFLSIIFHKPFGDAKNGLIGCLAVTVCILLLAWRIGWL